MALGNQIVQLRAQRLTPQIVVKIAGRHRLRSDGAKALWVSPPTYIRSLIDILIATWLILENARQIEHKEKSSKTAIADYSDKSLR